MSSKDTGGSAYPCKANTYNERGIQNGTELREGMSLRDYFAGQALAGVLGNSSLDAKYGVHFVGNNEGLAMAVYSIADAMLKERNK